MSEDIASLLSHYQKHPKDAFMDGFTTRIHYEALDSEVYEVHKYYIPQHASRKVKWVRKYFERMHDQEIDIEYKRRKHWVEYAETSLLMLNRIFHLCRGDYTIVAGSQFVSPVAWAVFGGLGRSGPPICARNQFSTILELANHYRNSLHGDCYPIHFHFRTGLCNKLGKKFKTQPFSSANFWMAVAILLTYDIIHECGPDCPEFFELFTNDYRESAESFDVMRWEQLRCRILGVPGRVNVNRLPQGQIRYVSLSEPPKKPYRSKIEIELLSEGNDLASGEKTFPTTIKIDHSHCENRTYPHGATCPLPQLDLWSEMDMPGVHGAGIRHFHKKQIMGSTPDMI